MPSVVPNVPCGVERTQQLAVGGEIDPILVPNAPCGVERESG